MDLTEVLPDDVLANILNRLPPPNLAAARCVRKVWRAVVDAHGLLLPHLLPHMVSGIFISRKDLNRPISLFARPSPQQPAVNGDLGFLPRYGGRSRQIVDHCNGLLLCRDLRTLCVVNPVTRRWDHLPWEDDECNAYLAFDPAASLHYEVFSMPHEPHGGLEYGSLQSSPEQSDEEGDDPVKCPSSLWMLNVFSSSTGQWHKRSFVGEAQATDTLAYVRLDPTEPTCIWLGGTTRCSSSVYWRGSLYLNFRGFFVVRLSSSDGTYRVIKTPIDIEKCEDERPSIGRSENGLYFATFNDTFQLRVWILMESSEPIDWELKHHVDLKPCAKSWLSDWTVFEKAWILDGGNSNMLVTENLDWDSDDDNVVDIQDSTQALDGYIGFLGFHPFKEVVFLALAEGVGVAYHLNSSKFQYLGIADPTDYPHGIYETFPYTPCMIGPLLKHFRGS